MDDYELGTSAEDRGFVDFFAYYHKMYVNFGTSVKAPLNPFPKQDEHQGIEHQEWKRGYLDAMVIEEYYACPRLVEEDDWIHQGLQRWQSLEVAQSFCALKSHQHSNQITRR